MNPALAQAWNDLAAASAECAALCERIGDPAGIERHRARFDLIWQPPGGLAELRIDDAGELIVLTPAGLERAR